MKKWISIIVALVVIAAASGTNIYFYVQQNNRLNQVDQNISGLVDNLNGVQSGLTSLQGNLSTLGDSVSSLSNNVGTLGGKITDLQGTTSGLSSDVSTIQGNISTINGNLSSVSSSVTTLQNNVSGLQSSVSGIQSSVSALQANAQAVSNVLAKLTPTVVLIVADVGGGYISGGTGVIVRANGYILTAYHVVQGALSIEVTLSTGDNYSATISAYDPNLDLAVLKLNTTLTNFPVATLGSSSDSNVGDTVLAIGFPFILPGTASVTEGIISAFRTDDGTYFVNNGEKYIQTDAAINPGNSGGPLVNLNGDVIGIADFSLLYSSTPEVPADNMGFFVAVEQANPLIVQAAGS